VSPAEASLWLQKSLGQFLLVDSELYVYRDPNPTLYLFALEPSPRSLDLVVFALDLVPGNVLDEIRLLVQQRLNTHVVDAVARALQAGGSVASEDAEVLFLARPAEWTFALPCQFFADRLRAFISPALAQVAGELAARPGLTPALRGSGLRELPLDPDLAEDPRLTCRFMYFGVHGEHLMIACVLAPPFDSPLTPPALPSPQLPVPVQGLGGAARVGTQQGRARVGVQGPGRRLHRGDPTGARPGQVRARHFLLDRRAALQSRRAKCVAGLR
jgi:hypothetical protein